MVCLMCSSLVDNFYQPLVDNLIVWGQAPLRHRPTPLPHPQTKMLGSAIPRPSVPVLCWSHPSGQHLVPPLVSRSPMIAP